MVGIRGLSSERARKVRQDGHDDALLFALLMGLDADYENDRQAKKDVIDPSGDAYSVKSGVKKWQIFLYGWNRFHTDIAFGAMNGLSELCKECIDAFPPTFEEYQKDKHPAKEALKIPMRKIADKLQDKRRLMAFMQKSIFNGNEVSYLAIKENPFFHVFRNEDVIALMGEKLEVCNSKKRSAKQYDDQKVIFKYNGLNLAELEMRNDSPVHYREIRFNMYKARAVDLLFNNISPIRDWSPEIKLYGKTIKSFGNWKKNQ